MSRHSRHARLAWQETAGRLFTRGLSAAGLAIAVSVGGLAAVGSASVPALAASTAGGALSQAGASSNVTFFRQAGPDRYATAAAIATDTFGSAASTVVLTTGSDFPDALAGAYLAGNEAGGSPILLTDPSALSPAASTALSRLHATRVVIVGGTSAVSAAVQESLAAHYQVSRIAGGDRYATDELLATQPGTQVGTDSSGQRSAILVSGVEFPDALSAAALAYARHLPIVLTAPAQLSAQAVAVLHDDHIAHVVQVGGSGAIDPSVTRAVQAMGITLDEVAGTNRSQTSTLLAADEVHNYGLSNVHLDLASGTDFADALAGGAHAGAEAAPVVLTTDGSDPGAVPAWVAGNCRTLSSADVFGGTGALGSSTESLIGLACPSNGSVQLSVGIGPVTATSPAPAAATTVPASGPTEFTASVEVCGPPGSLSPCRIGSDQAVVFSAFPSRPGACGMLSPTSAMTGSSSGSGGSVAGEASTSYSAGATPGTCVVTATANGYSSSLALGPTLPVLPVPCTCCAGLCCNTACCGPIPAAGQSAAGQSPDFSGCCGRPPCVTQVCPLTASPVTSGKVQPAVIVCPLQPATVVGGSPTKA